MQNIALNGIENVIAENAALGDVAGEGWVRRVKGDDSSRSVVLSASSNEPPGGGSERRRHDAG